MSASHVCVCVCECGSVVCMTGFQLCVYIYKVIPFAHAHANTCTHTKTLQHNIHHVHMPMIVVGTSGRTNLSLSTEEMFQNAGPHSNRHTHTNTDRVVIVKVDNSVDNMNGSEQCLRTSECLMKWKASARSPIKSKSHTLMNHPNSVYTIETSFEEEKELLGS